MLLLLLLCRTSSCLICLLLLLLAKKRGVLVRARGRGDTASETRLAISTSRSVHGVLALSEHDSSKMLCCHLTMLLGGEVGVLSSIRCLECVDLVKEGGREGGSGAGGAGWAGRHVEAIGRGGCVTIVVCGIEGGHDGLGIVHKGLLGHGINTVGSVNTRDAVAHIWRGTLLVGNCRVRRAWTTLMLSLLQLLCALLV